MTPSRPIAEEVEEVLKFFESRKGNGWNWSDHGNVLAAEVRALRQEQSEQHRNCVHRHELEKVKAERDAMREAIKRLEEYKLTASNHREHIDRLTNEGIKKDGEIAALRIKVAELIAKSDKQIDGFSALADRCEAAETKVDALHSDRAFMLTEIADLQAQLARCHEALRVVKEKFSSCSWCRDGHPRGMDNEEGYMAHWNKKGGPTSYMGPCSNDDEVVAALAMLTPPPPEAAKPEPFFCCGDEDNPCHPIRAYCSKGEARRPPSAGSARDGEATK